MDGKPISDLTLVVKMVDYAHNLPLRVAAIRDINHRRLVPLNHTPIL